MSEWMIIETAPKDGARVLVKDASGWVTIARWAEDETVFEGETFPHWVSFACEDYYYSIHLLGEDEPVLWMPLP